MKLKAHVLAVASTATLRQIAEDFDLSIRDKRKRQDLIARILSARHCKPGELLGYLSESDVKQVCEAAGVDSLGTQECPDRPPIGGRLVCAGYRGRAVSTVNKPLQEIQQFAKEKSHE